MHLSGPLIVTLLSPLIVTLTVAFVIMVPVGRAQALPAAGSPGSVRARALWAPPPPWAPAPRVESELFEICIFEFEVEL